MALGIAHRAAERNHACDPQNRLIAAVLEREWNDAVAARLEFEQRLAQEAPATSQNATDAEVEELQRLAADVPALWAHPVVTNLERKALLRTLISHIEVDRTDESIEATIHWRSGQAQPFRVWLRAAFHRLLRESHDQGMSVREIVASFKTPDPITGQRWMVDKGSIYLRLKNWGLKPNPPKRRRRA